MQVLEGQLSGHRRIRSQLARAKRRELEWDDAIAYARLSLDQTWRGKDQLDVGRHEEPDVPLVGGQGPAALLVVAISGCAAVPSSSADVQLRVRNTTDAPVTFRFIEYDFEANEPGPEVALAAPTLQAGESTEIGIVAPDVESWAYLVNDLVGVASFELPEITRSMPGTGPLVFDISVTQDGL